MKLALFLLSWVLATVAMAADPVLPTGTTLVNGFVRKLSGTDLSYHSSIPTATEALLARATDGTSAVEWETAPAPEASGPVTFAWLAGIGSSPGKASFDVAVNGIRKFTLQTDGTDHWLLKHEDGSELAFRKDLIDQNGDRFGFLFLTIPASQIRPGQPLTLRVTGANAGKTSWYMTFKTPLATTATVRALPASFTEQGTAYQAGLAEILHFGQPATTTIHLAGSPPTSAPLQFGYNPVRLKLPAVDRKTQLGFRLELPGGTQTGEITLQPVRQWRVDLIQHSHTDIGYTRPQTDILGEHLRFIDYALDYCDRTDAFPDAAKFRWTCEAAWAVDQYLQSRPARQIARLKQRVKEGRIELTGMFFNFDELPDEATLAASLQPLRRFREQGMPVVTAMQNDVNGIGWCLCDYFADLGIKYLSMGTHGHRALICFDKPTLFWWESPSGKRVLAFRAEHYMTGNTVLKIHAGDFTAFERELLGYLTNLAAKGYAYDRIAIQHSGFQTDNSPPSILASEMIRQWNERYTWPRLRTATATGFFTEMEATVGATLPVIRGAWPDWWTDGFGASAREVAATRAAQSDLLANTAGLTLAALRGSPLPRRIDERIEATHLAQLFYTEHTVGYHDSVREPYHPQTMEQRAIKESYAWEAARRSRMLGEEALGLLQEQAGRAKEPSFTVFNTLNWSRSGLVKLYIDHQIIPRYTPFSITAADGRAALAQLVQHHSGGTDWAIWVDDIPACGFKRFLIRTGPPAAEATSTASSEPPTVIENAFYRILLNPAKAAISSLFDKELGLELVDPKALYQLGEFIYETLGNRAQLETRQLDAFTREGLAKAWFDSRESGPVWDTIRFKGNTRAAERDGTYQLELRLFHPTKRLDLVYAIEKKSVTEPEGIYIALPFALTDGVPAFDVQGGEVRAGIDQLPGSSNDWNTVQNYARVSNRQCQLVVSSPEAPLMQFGAINTGRFKAGARPATTHIYGWPMNNYWVTNFNPEQHGGSTWTYSLTSRRSSAMQDALRYGWGNRTPLLARVLPGGEPTPGKTEDSWLTGFPDHVLLVSALPAADGQSAILHLRETGGRAGTPALRAGAAGPLLPCQQVDATGVPVPGGTLELAPYGTKFYRVDLAPRAVPERAESSFTPRSP